MPHRRSAGAALAEEFRLLGDTLCVTNDVKGALHAVVQLAVRTIDHCDWAGLSQVTGSPAEHLTTVAASDPVVRTADQVQDQVGEGPCLVAVRTDTVVHEADLRSTTRFPRYGAAVSSRTEIRAALALPIHPAPTPAVLTLYGSTSRAFTAETVDTATLFAAHAQVLLLLARQSDRITDLTDALTTSRLIGNAVGILMYAHRISGAEAFDRLTRAGRDLERRLSDLAGEVTTTGRLPCSPHAQDADAPAERRAPTVTTRRDRQTTGA